MGERLIPTTQPSDEPKRADPALVREAWEKATG